MVQQPPVGQEPPHYQNFTITIRHTTLGRTPLHEWSARRRNLYLTTHNTHKRQTSMPPAGFFFPVPLFPFDPFRTFKSFRPSSCHLWPILVLIQLTQHKHPCPGGIRTHNPSKRAAADPHLSPRGHWDRQLTLHLAFQNTAFYAHSVHVCCTWSSQETANISLRFWEATFSVRYEISANLSAPFQLPVQHVRITTSHNSATRSLRSRCAVVMTATSQPTVFLTRCPGGTTSVLRLGRHPRVSRCVHRASWH
jgi:hypothetical protein